MRVGLQIPQFRPSTAVTMGSWFAEIAQAAEANEIIQHKFDILKKHCDAVERPYEAIEKTSLDTFTPTEQSMADLEARVRELHDMGFSHAIFNINGDYTPERIAEMGQKVVASAQTW